MKHTESQKKIVFRLLALASLVSLCLSVVFVSHHIDHDCTGEDCPVCAVIEVARANFHALRLDGGNFVQIQFFSFIPVSFFVISAFVVLSTPVTEKIKMND